MRSPVVKSSPFSSTKLKNGPWIRKSRNRLWKMIGPFDMDKESSILWMLHTQFGFGPKRLKLAWKLFYAETLKLREYYLMEQADDGWLARKKLKDIGCDIEEWYREEGGKTDA